MGREKLKKANYLSLATFRKSGVAVETPVWFAEENDAFYIFSAGNAGKVKRLHNSSRSRIAACTMSGKITGDWSDTEGHLLSEPGDAKKFGDACRADRRLPPGNETKANSKHPRLGVFLFLWRYRFESSSSCLAVPISLAHQEAHLLKFVPKFWPVALVRAPMRANASARRMEMSRTTPL